MEKVTFYSYKPYLFIGIQRENGISVTFSAECTYSPTNEEELQCLSYRSEEVWSIAAMSRRDHNKKVISFSVADDLIEIVE